MKVVLLTSIDSLEVGVLQTLAMLLRLGQR